MPVSLIPSFLLYCLIGAITPGPANLCSLSAALRCGKKAALRQVRGQITGFAIISLVSVLVTWLLGTALNRYVGMLSWVGAAYILWLAWQTLMDDGSAGEENNPAAPCFRTGLLLQMTNAKVMFYCLSSLSMYVLPYSDSLWSLLPVGIFLPFTGGAANLVWLFAGASLQKLFANHRKGVNVVMAISLTVCAVSLVWPH